MIYKPSRFREAGNIFFALFGAIAMVGILGGAVMTFMKGPLSTSVKLTKANTAESQMAIGAQVAVMATASQADSGDCDSDGYVEPIAWRAATTEPIPVNGGLVPLTLGMSKKDPWGTEYGYCVWNHGAVTSGSGCDANMLAGTASKIYPVVAIVSAGPDKTFTTTCRTFAVADANSDGDLLDAGDAPLVSKAAESDDDIIFTYTYEEATGASGGLWNLKSGDPTTAAISKNIEVTGDATIGGGGNIAGGIILPNSATITCDGTTLGVLARNGTSDALQICDGSGWQDISGSGGGGGGGTGEMLLQNQTVYTDGECSGANTGLLRYRTTSAGDDTETTVSIADGTSSGGVSFVGATTGTVGAPLYTSATVPSMVQKTTGTYCTSNCSATTLTRTFPSTPLLGNTVLALVTGVGGVNHGCDISGQTTVTDNKGNIYTKAFASNEGYPWRPNVGVWYAPIGTTSSGFTVSLNNTDSECDSWLTLTTLEVYGLDTSSDVVDASGSSYVGYDAAPITVTTPKTIQDREFAVALLDSPAGFGTMSSMSPGWTYMTDSSGEYYHSYQVLSMWGAVENTWDYTSTNISVGGIVTFRAAGSSLINSSQGLSLDVPDGVASGDLLVFSVSTDEGTLADITWPAGFTELANQYVAAPDGQSWAVAYKISDGTESSLAVTDATTYSMVGTLMAYRGVDTSTPVTVYSTRTDTATTASPWTDSASSITTILDHSKLVFVGSVDPDSTAVGSGGTLSSTPPAGFTERVDLQGSGSFQGESYLTVADFDQTLAGATGTISATIESSGGGTARAGSILFAINPASSSWSEPDSTITTGSYDSYVEVCNGSEWTVIGPGALNDLLDAHANYTGTESADSSLSTYSIFLGIGSGDSAASGATRNTGLGVEALLSLATGTDNTAFGGSSLRSDQAGSYNSVFGTLAGYWVDDGNSNSAFGNGALHSNTSGSGNSALGADSLSNNMASGNTALGMAALYNNITGTANTAVGYFSLDNATDANNNTAVGYYAGYGSSSEISGNDNLFFGYQDHETQYTTGDRNVSFGANNMGQDVTDSSGSDNVSFGYMAMYYAGGGSKNVAVGFGSMGGPWASVSRVDEEVAIGSNADSDLYSAAAPSTVRYNTAVGPNSLTGGTHSTNTGMYNTGVGNGALSAGTGSRNTCLGEFSCPDGDTSDNVSFGEYTHRGSGGERNTSFGYENFHGEGTLGADNVAIGHMALYSCNNYSGSVAVGQEAMYNFYASGSGTSYSTAFGHYSMRVSSGTGLYNTAVGYGSLNALSSGSGNVVIGSVDAGEGITSGSSNVVLGNAALKTLTTGSYNVAIGTSSLMSAKTSASNNVAVGTQALSSSTTAQYNTAIGYQAGRAGTAITTGGYNTFIGDTARSAANNYTNGTAIGSTARLTGSNLIVLGNTAITQIRAQVTSITAISDRRHKKDITEDDLGLAFIDSLMPVSYRFNNGDETLRYGFIAQDIEKSLPETLKPLVNKEEGGLALVTRDHNDEGTYHVSYGELIAPIVKAVQELDKKLDAVIETLSSFIKDTKTQIAELFDKDKALKEQIAAREERIRALKERIGRLKQVCEHKDEIGMVAQ